MLRGNTILYYYKEEKWSSYKIKDIKETGEEKK